MGFHVITSRGALIIALQLASAFTFVGEIAARQSSSQAPNPEETDHVQLSTPVVKAWREITIGSPVWALDDAVGAKDWLKRSFIERIDVQTGKWYVWIEPGYSVFRIYPYLSTGSPQPRVYQGMVLKVNGTLSVKELLEAIQNRASTITIDEYEVFGAHGVAVRRYSKRSNRGQLRH